MTERLRVSVVGGSGYTGGEVIRLLLGHPHVEIQQVTSRSNAGKYVHAIHPNLRKRTQLQFEHPDNLKPSDLLFLCMPNGQSVKEIERYLPLADRVIDLSADFRLRNPADYERWYHYRHSHPDLLREATYGIPELHREEIKNARLVTGAGCTATGAILGLMPLFKAGVVRPEPVVIETKIGSSAAGAEPNPGSHHPERSGAMRSYEPTNHRHTAEVRQELTFNGITPNVHLSATAVDAVRGELITAHVFLKQPMADKDIWKIYRQAYANEPFMRIVKERTGIYRYPEPKILIGSNFADVGFEIEEGSDRVVVMCALDNMMKGASGNGVQAMNVMYDWDETTGLEFTGLHPV